MSRRFETGCREEGAKGHQPVILFLLLLSLFLLVGACGKKMVPIEADKALPAAVREFSLSQEGDSLVLSWQFPRENRLGQPLTQLEGFRLYRCEGEGVQAGAVCPMNFVLWADIDLAYPRVGKVQGETVIYEDRDLAPDRRYFYRVAAYDQGGYKGDFSQVLSRAWGWPPRAPRDLKAEAGDRVVQLTWAKVSRLEDGSPVRDFSGYLVYRRTGIGSWQRLTAEPVSGTEYQDVAVLNDMAYSYMIRAVRKVGPDLVESRNSPILTAQPEKRTGPPPILNLVALPGPQGVELHWDPSPASDLAGYRVYRRVEGESQFSRMPRGLLTKPVFLDSRVTRGRTYYYYVTAVDNTRRANESLPSEDAVAAY